MMFIIGQLLDLGVKGSRFRRRRGEGARANDLMVLLSKPSKNIGGVFEWNSAIRECVKQNRSQKALLLFRQMKQNGLEADNFTFPLLAKASTNLCSLRSSQIIHSNVLKSPFRSDLFVQTAMLDMYVKCQQLTDACLLFDRIPVRDVASWNVMVLGFAQSGFLDKVLGLFRDMRFDGILPDTVTVVGLTRASLDTKNLALVKSVHAFGIRIGIDGDVSMANTWISAYAKCEDLSSAMAVFNGVEIGVRTVVSWNSLIAGYGSLEKLVNALSFYKWMLCDGYRPDTSTIVSLLSSCIQPDKLFQGALIHCHGIKLGCNSDIFVVNALISMYSRCGDILSSRFLFDGMTDRTCVSWTAIISGYAESRDLDEALRLFHAMEVAGVKPDVVTVLSLVSGCGLTGALELGKWIHQYAFSNGLRDNIVVCNALIDMYAKCGNIISARELFNVLPVRTVVSWTTMITGCALNGEYKEALDLFSLMVEFGLKPNHMTFLAILQACTHAGLLEKGLELFHMMREVYNIYPGVDHYSCIADLLGRKGRLKEAVELVESMPVKPDAGIWSALLSACKIHHNVEMGEYACGRLFELEPDLKGAVPFVEMANIYASKRRWDEVAAVRRAMKINKVKKFPGQSLVHVNGKPHVFTVEDRGHLDSLLLYATLDSLSLQSKEEYWPYLEDFVT
ncbi:pentatricopeptide repeat-containing protein [Pyrus ussuriensis x Pyrus communis]|uniref:Pentatricopeptide repeat-containing protein n=1 Tax=Pyrus ussuriensis x Pyrus communis TaxID=2448454 RepID=A0A5N5GP60_9ROSA|nr:pentatricopeptide repeat-containing protein [Pyrus ussuriensis x Pyrus communis]